MKLVGLIALSTVSLAVADDKRSWTYWDRDGQKPKTVASYDSERRQHGDWMAWYENGQMRSKSSFEHGTLILFEAWYDNGQRRQLQPFTDDGLAHGLWIWWGPDGSVLARSFFEHGTGVEYYFNDSGTEEKRVFWISGVRFKQEEGTKKEER